VVDNRRLDTKAQQSVFH